MRVVNREDFLKMKSGTVYQKYEPHVTCSGICIKQESFSNDWCLISIDGVDSISDEPNGGQYDQFENLEKCKTESVGLEFWQGRDAEFNREGQFLVYEEKDVLDVINLLKGTLKMPRPQELKA